MSGIKLSETLHTCDKCGRKGERDWSRGLVDPMPDGWVVVQIYGNDGVFANSVVCEPCAVIVKQSLGMFRNMEPIEYKSNAEIDAYKASIISGERSTGDPDIDKWLRAEIQIQAWENLARTSKAYNEAGQKAMDE